MYSLSQARRILEEADLVEGLPTKQVQDHIGLALRVDEVSRRIAAFYLAEMERRGLYTDTGHSSAIQFAEQRFHVDRRRAGELLAIGKKLRFLPRIDAAFCEQRLCWSKLLLLAKVATPEHEETWLETALSHNVQGLKRQVMLSKEGHAPRRPGDVKSVSEVHYGYEAKLDPMGHEMVDRAMEKLGDETGETVNTGSFLVAMAQLLLETDPDGTVPGRKPIKGSLYRIVLRASEVDTLEAQAGPLFVDTEDGPMPIHNDQEEAKVRSDVIRCDAETWVVEDEPCGCPENDCKCDPRDRDHKTPDWLRQRVLARDRRCRCCGSRHALTVHHIHWREYGGLTTAWNLITLCTKCHSLVHARLLFIKGKLEKRALFFDRHGIALHQPGAYVTPATLLQLTPPKRDGSSEDPPLPDPAPVTLPSLPDEVDREWWQRHRHLVAFRPATGLEWTVGTPLPEGHDAARVETPERTVNREEALEGWVGQQRLLRHLEKQIRGSRARNRSFPHTLFTGPAGTGKTTLARGVAALAGAKLHSVCCSLLSGKDDLVRLIAGLAEGDMLFLDEIHALPKATAEVLYDAMATGHVTLTLHSGARARSIRLALPPFTLLAATTEEGVLTDALLSRFAIRASLGLYGKKALTRLVRNKAEREGFELDAHAAERLAKLARGTPREALNLLDRAISDAAADGLTVIGREAVEATLKSLGYDAHGHTRDQRRLLEVLRDTAKPRGVDLLARILGMTARAIVRQIEPGLIQEGLIEVTSRGRVAVLPPPKNDLEPALEPTRSGSARTNGTGATGVPPPARAPDGRTVPRQL